MLYVREDVPAKLLSHDFPSADSFFIESNLFKKKWLIKFSYNPHKSYIGKHFDNIIRSLDTLSTKFLMILMQVLVIRLYKHLANFILCIVSLNNLHALKILRTLAVLI